MKCTVLVNDRRVCAAAKGTVLRRVIIMAPGTGERVTALVAICEAHDRRARRNPK